MSEPVVCLDGWSLVHAPNSPAAVHTIALLENPPDGVQVILALPGQPFEPIPGSADCLLAERGIGLERRLDWEQRRLPRLASQAGAGGIHLTSGAPALFSPAWQLLSPAGYTLARRLMPDPRENTPPARTAGLPARLHQALLMSAAGRASNLVWPEDLPLTAATASVVAAPLVVPAVFFSAAPADAQFGDMELPESYVLYHGPGAESDLRRLLDAWSWASPALGEETRLILAGLAEPARDLLAGLASEYHLERTVDCMPDLPLAALAALYQRCSSLFHPVLPVSPWGDSLALAAACGRPVVAYETIFSDARLGTAGYLISPDDSLKATSRALGAALITVIVDEDLAQHMAEEAVKRSMVWQASGPRFRASLGEACARALAG